MELKIDPQNLKDLMGQAIMASLTPEVKALLIQASLDKIVAPRSTSSAYNAQKTSPLEDAFDQAMHIVVRQLAAEVLEGSETKEKLRSLLTQAVNKILTSDQDNLSSVLASSIAKGLSTLKDY